MKDILRTTDPVLLTFAESMLAAEGIAAAVFDLHASAVEGSISAIPRRLMVADEDEARAREIVKNAIESRSP
jgi:Putative prokaryotic signal transducing protein